MEPLSCSPVGQKHRWHPALVAGICGTEPLACGV